MRHLILLAIGWASHASAATQKYPPDSLAQVISRATPAGFGHWFAHLDTTLALAEPAASLARASQRLDQSAPIARPHLSLARARQTDKDAAPLQKHAALHDSTTNQRNRIELQKIQGRFELDKKQVDLALLQKDHQLVRASVRKQEAIILTAAIGLFFISLLALLVYGKNRQIRRANRLLETQASELTDMNAEINRQNQAIISLNGSLETLVSQRTQQLEMALEDLTHKNQDLEQFSYIISHNMRSPINRLVGLASIFNRSNLADPANLFVLENLEKAARSLHTVVDDLSDILAMRHQAGKPKEEVSLPDITALVLDNLQTDIKKAQAEISVDFSRADHLLGIRGYLHSIIHNLVSNAIKYRAPERPPCISIRTKEVGNCVCLTVQDNGLGIDFAKTPREKIFGLYKRVHTHTEGKGIGLYLVKEQVEALNGRIEVESEPGKGATFRIYFQQPVLEMA